MSSSPYPYDLKRIPPQSFPASLTPALIMPDMREFLALSFTERMRKSVRAWALEGYGIPALLVFAYVIKMLLYFAVYWYFLLPWSPNLIASLERFIAWSIMVESTGFGCASGPLAAKYDPYVTGFRHFFSVGTVKIPSLPFFNPKANVLSGFLSNWGFDMIRGPLDVAVFLCLQLCCGLTMLLGTPSRPIVAGLIYFGFSDRTVYVSSRADYYLPLLMCFSFADNDSELLVGLQLVQLFVWIFAAASKHGPWFSYVNAVMVSNSFLLRFQWIRRLFYRFEDNPKHADDLGIRLSPLAHWVATFGKVVEFLFPAMMFHDSTRDLGVIIGILFHIYIMANVPMATPTEWNIYVVVHTYITLWQKPLTMSALSFPSFLSLYLAMSLVIVPIVGQMWPNKVSFLAAFRYYAGNWATNIFLIKRDTAEKKILDNVPSGSPALFETVLKKMYKDDVILSVEYKAIAFRMMHYFGLALPRALLVALANVPGSTFEEKIDQYIWVDGEMLAGHVLGHSFGDGYLNDEKLLYILQELCDFKKHEVLHIAFDSCSVLAPYSVPMVVRDAAEAAPLWEGSVNVESLAKAQ